MAKEKEKTGVSADTAGPSLSVITVVYNNVRDIERTMQSVLGQSYPYIEYIIIDGGSTDGTLDLIAAYRDRLAVVVSEPDKGIYDAMNKGLERAAGDYVLFMNSGDEIYDNQTVDAVFASAPGADIYYGETELYNDNWQPIGLRRHRAPQTFTWKSFRYGMNISHQAIYIRRKITSLYDPRYRLSADVDWVIRAARNARSICNTQRLVAKYLVGGMSKKQHRRSLKERFLILSRHYGWLPNIMNHLIILLRYAYHTIRHGKPKD